jgi:hypothetical protein
MVSRSLIGFFLFFDPVNLFLFLYMPCRVCVCVSECVCVNCTL